MRLNDRMMNALRKGLVDSGFPAVELTKRGLLRLAQPLLMD